MGGTGKLSIVGVGPGDPGLISEVCRRLLQACDVIFYDESVNERVLSLAGESAELISVGGVDGQPPLPQDRVNSLIERKARLGLRVVRLYGGDPFLFGSGADEALHCRLADIEVEIIPGISITGAISAYSGIPLMYKELAGTVFVTAGPYSEHKHPRPSPNRVNAAPAGKKAGIKINKRKKSPIPAHGEVRGLKLRPGVHLKNDGQGHLVPADHLPEKKEAEHEEHAEIHKLNWRALARAADTLVFLNAEDDFTAIRKGLVFGGRPLSELIAAVSTGTAREHKTIISTIERMVFDLERTPLPAPVTLIVGDVVGLHDHLALNRSQSLSGRRIGIIHGAAIPMSLEEELAREGAGVETFRVLVPCAVQGLNETIRQLEDDLAMATDVVYTHPEVVDRLSTAMTRAGVDWRIFPRNARILACGKETHRALAAKGILSHQVPEEVDADVLAVHVSRMGPEARMIVLGHPGFPQMVLGDIRSRGTRVTYLPVLEFTPRRTRIAALREAVRTGRINMLVLFSREALHAAIEQWGESGTRLILEQVDVVAGDHAGREAIREMDVILHPTQEVIGESGVEPLTSFYRPRHTGDLPSGTPSEP